MTSLRSGIRIRRGPTSTDCLAWSEDYEIAVACDDTLEVLFPKLSVGISPSDTNETEAAKWQTVRVPVNSFTPKELSLPLPSPFSIFSIGEEQSSSSIAAIAWSPSGLARFKRCALAVLTTNLLLSIWVHDGRPTSSSDWKRVLIVNDTLQMSFSRSEARTSADDSLKYKERTRSRVRSFCWCPSLKKHSYLRGSSASRTQKPVSFFVAVSNDAREIVICEIRSPFMEPLRPQPSWTARSVFRFDLAAPSNPDSAVFGPTNFATNLAWSPWIKEHPSSNSESRSCLSFVSNSIGYLKSIVLEDDVPQATLKTSTDSVPLGSQFSGQMRWAYHPTDDKLLVLASVNERVLVAHVSLVDPDIGPHVLVPSQSENIFSWHRASGIAFGARNDNATLYTVSELMERMGKPLSFNVPLEESGVLDSQEWASGTTELNEALIDAEKAFPFGSVVRFWGLSSTLNLDHLAFCASVHPKDVIYHTIAADRESVIFIKPTSDSIPRRILTSSAEATWFSVARYIGYHSSENISSTDRLDLFHNWLDSTSIVPRNWKDLLRSKPNITAPEDVVSFLRMVFEPNTVAISRIYSCLSRPQEDTTARNEPPSEFTSLWTLICSIQKMPNSIWKPTKLTNLIVWKLFQTKELLQKVWPDYFKQEPRRSFPLYSLGNKRMEEKCQICESEISLEDPSWAQCAEGHQFARCGLTLLAIQTPGSSKYCGICGKRYLAESYLTSSDLEETLFGSVDADEQNSATSDEEAASRRPALVEILLAGCETCIICGGKFTIA